MSPHPHPKEEVLHMPTNELEIRILEAGVFKYVHFETWNLGCFFVSFCGVSVLGHKRGDACHPDLYEERNIRREGEDLRRRRRDIKLRG